MAMGVMEKNCCSIQGWGTAGVAIPASPCPVWGPWASLGQADISDYQICQIIRYVWLSDRSGSTADDQVEILAGVPEATLLCQDATALN